MYENIVWEIDTNKLFYENSKFDLTSFLIAIRYAAKWSYYNLVKNYFLFYYNIGWLSI